MDYKDYYASLGVSKNASQKEIKSAFRKLARKYHPDVNPGDAAAEARFKEINEAQAVLTDPEKRKKYDTLGPDWEKRYSGAHPGTGGYTYTSTGGAPTGDYSDFFESLFGQRGTQQQQSGNFDFDLGSLFGRNRARRAEAPQRGGDVEQPIDVTLREAFSGGERAFTIQQPQQCPTCKGTGLVDDQLCPTCGGTSTIARNKRLDVKIPPGVRDGSRIRVAGEGNPGKPNGDLYLLIHVVPEPGFRREGDDLHTSVDVPLTTLVLGGEVQVPTLNGRLTVSVPAGSQNGRTLRLTGQGMPALRDGQRGNLYVKLNAVLPTRLNEEQKNLFQQLAAAGV